MESLYRILDKMPLASVLAVGATVATIVAVIDGTPLSEALESLAYCLAGAGVLGFVRNQADKGTDY